MQLYYHIKNKRNNRKEFQSTFKASQDLILILALNVKKKSVVLILNRFLSS